MSEVFGPVTPALLIVVSTLAVQFVKKFWPDLQARYVQLLALAFSLLLVIPFHLLQSDVVDGWSIYSSIIYALVAWFASIGVYEVGIKPQ